ncbi:MAG TPA: hypothetical protein VF665_15640, partial [Longimicrobium sp.]|uniref:hypothetical protein n=1 Tax=Longimicrobium sp. TaxID=2029185 RepID=UPI002ED89CC2
MALACAAVAACAAGAAVGIADQAFMGPETVLCAVLAALILAPVVYRAASGTFDLFEPVVLVSAIYLLYFVVGPLMRFATDRMVFVGYDFQQAYRGGLMAVGVVVASMWAGYAVPVGPAPGTAVARRRVWDPAAARRMAWALAGLALLGMVGWSRIAGRSLGTFFLPGLFGALEGGEGGTDVAYLFLAIEWFIPALLVLVISGGLRRRWSLAAVVVLVSIVYVSIGFRYRLLVMWLALGILLYLRRESRPRLAVLVPSGAVMFLFVGWLAWARTFFRTGGAAGGLDLNFADAIEGALSDTRIFETFCVVMQRVPAHIDYVGFAPLSYIFILP